MSFLLPWLARCLLEFEPLGKSRRRRTYPRRVRPAHAGRLLPVASKTVLPYADVTLDPAQKIQPSISTAAAAQRRGELTSLARRREQRALVLCRNGHLAPHLLAVIQPSASSCSS